jgi:hypothetical protein
MESINHDSFDAEGQKQCDTPFRYGLTRTSIRQQLGDSVFNVNWAHWKKLPEWPPEVAVCLLFGVEPNIFLNEQCRELMMVEIQQLADLKGNMTPIQWQQFGIGQNLPFSRAIRDIKKPEGKTKPQAESKQVTHLMPDNAQPQAEAAEILNETATNIVKPPAQRTRGKTQITIFLEKLCQEQDIDRLSGQSLVSAIKIFVDTKNSIEKQNCPVKKHHGWHKKVSVEWKPGIGSPKGSWGSKSFQNFVGEYKKTNAKTPVKD